MNEFQDFEQDGDVVKAIPKSSRDEPVRFDASIADRPEDEEEMGNWETLVGELMDHDLGEALEIEGTEAVISRDQAIEALIEADEETVQATTEHQATAVLEFLDDEQILDFEEQQVVVLKSLEEIDDDYVAMYNNWAAMFDTCIERIDYANERVEQAKQRFENRETQTDHERSGVSPAQKKDEIEQEIKQLINEEGKQPSELEGEAKNKFDNLREEHEFYGQMERAKEPDIGSGVDKENELAKVMERFDVMRDVMADRRGELRQIALGKAIFPEDVVELSHQFADFLESMSSAMDTTDEMKDKSDDEFLDSISDSEGEFEQIEEQAREVSETPHATET